MEEEPPLKGIVWNAQSELAILWPENSALDRYPSEQAHAARVPAAGRWAEGGCAVKELWCALGFSSL